MQGRKRYLQCQIDIYHSTGVTGMVNFNMDTVAMLAPVMWQEFRPELKKYIILFPKMLLYFPKYTFLKILIQCTQLSNQKKS